MAKGLRPEDFRSAVPIGGRGEQGQSEPVKSILGEKECFKLTVTLPVGNALEIYSDERFGPNSLGIFTVSEGYVYDGHNGRNTGAVLLYKQFLVMALGTGAICAQIVKQPAWWAERKEKAVLAT